MGYSYACGNQDTDRNGLFFLYGTINTLLELESTLMLLAFYLKFDSVEARACIQAVNHFKKMDYCDYLFDYVRIDNTLIPTKNQYGLNKHYYVEMIGREHIELCDTKENKYLLRMSVDDTKMDRKVTETYYSIHRK